MRSRLALAGVLAVLILVSAAAAEPPSSIPTITSVPPAAQPSAHFDPIAATNAYLDLVPAAAKARSDAYFEGGYWLILWDFIYGAVVSLLLLTLGWSAAMRNVAERITRIGSLRTAIYWVEYLVVATILAFPLTLYVGYFREHKYGLATQTFGPWIGDQLKALLVGLIFGAIIAAALFGIVRRLPRTWWIWGSLVTVLFVTFGALIAPVYIVPLFNKVTRLQDPRITAPILRLARANGIPAKDIFEIDASRQTTRISANVSGVGKTLRITLNDNLLRRGTPEEIQAVMAHEMGHYVLNHVYKLIIFMLIIVVVWFAALRWALEASLKRWGERWQIRGIGDTAVLPLVMLITGLFFFLLTPVLNTMTRTIEWEADMYGLNAGRQPDGFAQAAVHLGEYRKLSPGPVEEALFFDHPSGRNRILAAMRWKAENLDLFTQPTTAVASPAVSPAPAPTALPRK